MKLGWTVRGLGGLVALNLVLAVSAATPALAHHALGGRLPANFFEGFISGLAHPVIGLDHLAFVVAIGLLAAFKTWGMTSPIAFVVAALGGTALHLQSVNLPGAELLISGSVLLFGVMLAMGRSPHWLVVTGLAAIAGIFHGYAYGESIVGAQMTPLAAYLLGFTTIQLVISLGAYAIARALAKPLTDTPNLSLRFAGFTICGIGATFLARTLVG